MQYFIFFVCALFGMIFHTAMKLNALKKQAKAANMIFKVSDFLQDDFWALVASFVSIFIWLLLFQETAQKYPAIIGYARFSFVLMGAIGSYIIQYVLGNAQKKITNIVDAKTNELDEIKK